MLGGAQLRLAASSLAAVAAAEDLAPAQRSARRTTCRDAPKFGS